MSEPPNTNTGKSRLKIKIRFQKCLRLAAEATTPGEAAAAEQAARSREMNGPEWRHFEATFPKEESKRRRRMARVWEKTFSDMGLGLDLE
jgi:hypothetical protein